LPKAQDYLICVGAKLKADRAISSRLSFLSTSFISLNHKPVSADGENEAFGKLNLSLAPIPIHDESERGCLGAFAG